MPDDRGDHNFMYKCRLLYAIIFNAQHESCRPIHSQPRCCTHSLRVHRPGSHTWCPSPKRHGQYMRLHVDLGDRVHVGAPDRLKVWHLLVSFIYLSRHSIISVHDEHDCQNHQITEGPCFWQTDMSLIPMPGLAHMDSYRHIYNHKILTVHFISADGGA